MQIAQRYLNEIDDICNDSEGRVGKVISEHWCKPGNYPGLFARCAPYNTDWHIFGAVPVSARDRVNTCGCLTQIRVSPHCGVFDAEGVQLLQLEYAIRNDIRLPKSYFELVDAVNTDPDSHGSVAYPLSDEQKAVLRKQLLVFAEYQTKFRLLFNDVNPDTLDLVEVEA